MTYSLNYSGLQQRQAQLTSLNPTHLSKQTTQSTNHNLTQVLRNLAEDNLATATLAAFKDHTDPAYIGPGTWSVIHRQAAAARDYTAQLQFIELMKSICREFPCSVCHHHCTEYIQNHPLEDYLNVQVEVEDKPEPLGLFVWAWKFHNAVNARLQKPIMSWETAYNLYCGEAQVCSQKCLEAENLNQDSTEVINAFPTLTATAEPNQATASFPSLASASAPASASVPASANHAPATGSFKYQQSTQPALTPFKLISITR